MLLDRSVRIITGCPRNRCFDLCQETLASSILGIGGGGGFVSAEVKFTRQHTLPGLRMSGCIPPLSSISSWCGV